MARHTGRYRRAHLVDRSTAVGWHQLVPSADGWRCALCFVWIPDDDSEIPGVCPDFLRPIEASTTASHDTPPPPGRLF